MIEPTDVNLKGIELRPPIDELLPSMSKAIVTRKDPVKPFGPEHSRFPRPLKFLVYIYDSFTNYKMIVDACHANSFSVGDQIAFTYKLKEDDTSYLLHKRHKIYNITRSLNLERVYTMRPDQEVEHLLKKVDKRYDEIKNSLATHPPVDTAVRLRAEKADLVRLLGLLRFRLTGKIIDHPEVDPRVAFGSCSIVTRYIGQEGETFESLLERAQRRAEVVGSSSAGTKEGEEANNLQKLIVVFKWFLDQAFDTDIGIHYGMGIFSRKLADDYRLRGEKRDEYKIPERASEDRQMLVNSTLKNIEKIKEQEQEKKLTSKFPFLAKTGIPKKGNKEKSKT